MMQFFRRMIGSKIGAAIALLFLGLVAFAFAAGDIERRASGNFFGTADTTAATIGGTTLEGSELENRLQRVFEANRQQMPTLTMADFLNAGGFTQVYQQLIDGIAMTEFGKQQGMRISKKLVDAEIARIPAFQGPTGQFDQKVFQDLLSRQHISEASLRDDIARDLAQRQIVSPAAGNSLSPMGMVAPYASMLLEKREGRVTILPSAAFVANVKPDDKAVAAFFAQNGARFALPETRRMRYAVVDISSFAGKVAPTDAEIAQYYKSNTATYAASETRTMQQLVLPTESFAKSIAAKASAGTLDDAAKGAGLSAFTLKPMDRTAFIQQASDEAAAKAFAAPKGALIGPLKVGLGWALYRVVDITVTPARSLEAARSEIAGKVTQLKTQQALSALATKIDGDVGKGSTFDEVVKANGLTTAVTPALTADGHDIDAPQGPEAKTNPDYVALAKAGFGMEQDDDPQVIQIVPDQRAALVAISQIVPTGPPPLAKIKPLVERAYLLDQGAQKAKAMAEKLRAKGASGTPFEQLAAGAGVPLPPVQKLGAQRSQLGQQGARVPAVMVALFSMKQGTTRLLPLPQDEGYALVHLDTIVPGDAHNQPQVLSATSRGLANVLTQEYAQQFTRAIALHVGVKRNEAGIARVQTDLRKTGGSPDQ